ncbi:putative lipoprotein [Latilactobacillus curvatus CRL 705]|nr:putative lipoprotein [Latilactobacillus curvatus CRL 705]
MVTVSTVLVSGLLLLGACGQSSTANQDADAKQSSTTASLKARESSVAKRESELSSSASQLKASSKAAMASSTEVESPQASSSTASVAESSSTATTASSSSQSASQSSSSATTTTTTTPQQTTAVDGNQAIKLVVQQVGSQFGQTASYLNNGLIIRGGQQGYLINIYVPNEDQPRAGYFVVQATGAVEQIW